MSRLDVPSELTRTLARRLVAFLHADDDEASWATRALICLGVCAYVAWHPLARVMMPQGDDPFVERAVVGMVCLTLVALSFWAPLRRQLDLFVAGSIYLGTFHHLWLTTRNQLSPAYLLAHFVLLGALGPLLVSLRATAMYGLVVTAASGVVAVDGGFDRALRLELVVGTLALMAVTTAGAWRANKLALSGRRQLEKVGLFFKNLVDVLPDPVFARAADGGWHLTNDAFDRSLHGGQSEEGAASTFTAPEVVAALERFEALAMATERPSERDVAFTGLDGEHRVVSLKVAAPRLRTGDRIVVGLLRDVTASRRMEASLKAKVEELERARTEVRRLKGLLPICMHCGNIRGEDGAWKPFERYVKEHTEAQVSHGLCDHCLDARYPLGAQGKGQVPPGSA